MSDNKEQLGKNQLEFLPTIRPMPTPPADSGDIEQWQKHIMEMNKYILDMNMLVQKMENNDFSTLFKQRMADKGIDIDKPDTLPPSVLEEIAGKMSTLLGGFRELSNSLNRHGTSQHKPVIKTNRNIKSI